MSNRPDTPHEPQLEQEGCKGSASPDCSAITDTQRLDWLQEHQATPWRCVHEERRATTMLAPAYEWVTVFDGWKVREEDEPMPTIREAIDAAIFSQNDEMTRPHPTPKNHE